MTTPSHSFSLWLTELAAEEARRDARAERGEGERRIQSDLSFAAAVCDGDGDLPPPSLYPPSPPIQLRIEAAYHRSAQLRRELEEQARRTREGTAAATASTVASDDEERHALESNDQTCSADSDVAQPASSFVSDDQHPSVLSLAARPPPLLLTPSSDRIDSPASVADVSDITNLFSFVEALVNSPEAFVHEGAGLEHSDSERALDTGRTDMQASAHSPQLLFADSFASSVTQGLADSAADASPELLRVSPPDVDAPNVSIQTDGNHTHAVQRAQCMRTSTAGGAGVTAPQRLNSHSDREVAAGPTASLQLTSDETPPPSIQARRYAIHRPQSLAFAQGPRRMSEARESEKATPTASSKSSPLRPSHPFNNGSPASRALDVMCAKSAAPSSSLGNESSRTILRLVDSDISFSRRLAPPPPSSFSVHIARAKAAREMKASLRSTRAA